MKAIGAVIAVVCAASAGAQVHFPPADGLWETVDPVDLGWCPEAVDSLVAFVKYTENIGPKASGFPGYMR